jgi:outer membrane protein TolC
MKISQLLLFGIFFSGISITTAQDKKSLTLDEAINMAWLNSNEVSLANTKVNTKKYELQAVKNERYPNVKVSGQYQHLTKATIDLKLNSTSTSSEQSPVVNQLLLGQINATLPVFSGFKIQNSIIALDNMFQAENANAMQTKEAVAMQVVNYYARLYKAQKTVELLQENQKSTKQRAVDFTALEKNGIIPRNDLLKAQLQVSKLQLSLDSATSELKNINYELVSLLKLDPSTNLFIKESDFANFQMNNIPTSETTALESRKDLEAIRLQEKASLANVKVAKSGYYPQIAIISGYTSLGLKNVVTVQNAINIGVGFSYDLSGILKNGTNVKIAQSKAVEVQNSENLLTDYIKIQFQKATEDYDLAIKQDLVYDEAVDQASENYRIIKEKYDNGLSDTNDLLEADVEQLGSKINKALAKANVIQKYYELLSISGQLNQTFNLSKI